MSPLEAKNASIVKIAGTHRAKRNRGEPKGMLMFVRRREKGRRDGEEWIELLEEFSRYGECARLWRWLYGVEKEASPWEDDYVRKLVPDGSREAQQRQLYANTDVRSRPSLTVGFLF